jgi:hypothetical protein
MGQILRISAPAAAVLWLNLYVCRDLFQSSFTGFTNSMQGFWSGLARLADLSHWFLPRWWPYHDGGSPFEWTYQPAVPALAEVWASIAGVDTLRGVQAVSGLVYVLGPVALFLFCAVATRRIGWSFAAAIAYSLLAPVEWVVPDTGLALAQIANSRRLYLIAAWDETPHYAALALLPLALLFVLQGIRTDRWRHWAGATVCMAAALMTSAFGATVLALGLLCLVLAIGRWQPVPRIVATAAAAWALASPSLPPSLIATIRSNAALHGDSGWDLGGLTAFAATVAGMAVILALCDRLRAGWWARFVWLFAWMATAIPALFQFFDRHFIPQPGRYKVEADLGLVLAGSVTLGWLLARVPRRVAAAFLLLAVSLAAEITVRHRRYEKQLVRDKDPASTLENRVAVWAASALPDGRVALPGSLALWFNHFAAGQQFSGSSYSTAYNPVQQIAWHRWLSAATAAEASDGLLWLKAFGTYAFAVPGPQSGEFWKALNHPELYLRCEPLWHESDTTVCRVPGARRSLAHVVPRAALVGAPPRHGGDTSELRRYTDALNAAGEATLEWQATSAAVIHSAPVGPDQALSVQISWHPGWQATVEGNPVAVRPDGLGLSVVEAVCQAPCEVRLRYTGGAELWLCHALRWTTVLVAGVLAWRRLSRRRGRAMAPDGTSDIT